ncbi:hypothetical protein V8E36_000691 [Tilletia maclaganii]
MGSSRVLFVGFGGGSCSGKTTLAKHILRILRQAGDQRSFIVHQDDFAPREEDLPWTSNGDEKVRDWDTPHGSIDFGKMHSVMRYIRTHAELPDGFNSHDKLNVLPDVAIPPEAAQAWADRFQSELFSNAAAAGDELVIVLVDGFLAYYDPRVRSELDVRFFTRSSREVLKSRRAKRSYVTAEESVWSDPPGYYDNVVWPAYVLAHKGMFENEDVERGALRPPSTSSPQPISPQANGDASDPAYIQAVQQEGPAGGPVRDLIILDERHEDSEQRSAHPAQAVSMADMVDRACQAILQRASREISAAKGR